MAYTACSGIVVYHASYRIILHHIVPYRISSQHVISYYLISSCNRIVSCCTISYSFISYRINVLCCIISYHIKSCHVVSYGVKATCIISCQMVPYIVIQNVNMMHRTVSHCVPSYFITHSSTLPYFLFPSATLSYNAVW